MSNSRDKILGRVRAATSALPSPTKHPEYAADLSVSKSGYAARNANDWADAFSQTWASVSGRHASDWAELASALKAETTGTGYCAPSFADQLRAVWPDAPITTEYDRAQVDNYAFGITPAWGAIAETGTIILTDGVSPARLAALAPWVHVAIVPRDRIFATVGEAIAALPKDPSIILVTGPSKTADIEGILIEGVHGPGIQFAMVAG